jgi:hypothetical protein
MSAFLFPVLASNPASATIICGDIKTATEARMKTTVRKRLPAILAMLTVALCAFAPIGPLGPTDANAKTASGDTAAALEVRVRYADRDEFQTIKSLDTAYFNDNGAYVNYSFVDQLPTVCMDEAKGVRLTTLLSDSDVRAGDVTRFTFWASDGQKSFSADELLYADGWYYPALTDSGLWEADRGGVKILDVAAASAGMRSVVPMLASQDNWYRIGGDMPEGPTEADRFRLMFGMPDFSGQADGVYVAANAFDSFKWIYRMDLELSTDAPVRSDLNGGSGSGSGGGSGGAVPASDSEDENASESSSQTEEEEEAPKPAFSHSLTDIRGHWAEENISKLVEIGAVSGNPDGSFKPNESITRAQFVSILLRVMVKQRLAYLDSDLMLNDTDRHWGRRYLAAAVKYGVLNPDAEGNVSPDRLITREEMAVMLARAVKLQGDADALDCGDKAEISSWAREAVAALTKNGSITGFPNGDFHPKDGATRAQAAVSVLRAFENAGYVL